MYTTSSVLSTVQKGDYAFKRDLQDMYFHIPIHPSSRKICLQKQGLPVSGNSLQSEHSPSDFTRLGHTVTGYLHHLGISVVPYLDDWLIHHPDQQVLLHHQARLLETLDLIRCCSKQNEIRAGSSARYPVSRNSPMFGLRGSTAPRVQSSGDSSRCVQAVLSPSLVLSSSGPTHGLNQLGLRSYPSGSFVPETATTLFSFIRPDRSVYTTASVRPLGPCKLTSAMAGPIFSYLWNPHASFPGGFYDLHGRLYSGLGRPHGGFPDFGYMGPPGPPAPYQLLGTQGSIGCSTSLGPSASGTPGDDRYVQLNSSFLYQQARRDSLPHLVTSGSGAVYVVTSSEHSCPSKTHPRMSERDSRPPISSQPADTDRVESPSRNHESNFLEFGEPQ